ncbi:lipoyl(octanoyl) transferase LipB [Actinoplanes sp. RD1]|uniref:lipoyl(octanoyl) transferase LipB n=1 Tax=Actinoplanes sp. RD1 TaxID=3064538 RepID=UPI002742890A|nr:lipoyl(octanoyl) transferase LipB [Actinoplanes sp. RD1]
MERVDLGEVPYDEGLRSMAGWVAERQAGRAPDRLFLLSHPPIITYGHTTPASDLPADLARIPAVRTDRGGHATYHGPGQLIGYLVLNLRERGPGDVIRWLETTLIAALADLGFATVRRDTPKGSPSLVGVWTPDGEKLVSIGMRIRGGVTSHGFALNIDPDLSVFDTFVACGLDDVRMTSLRRLSERQGVPLPPDPEIRDTLARHLTKAW